MTANEGFCKPPVNESNVIYYYGHILNKSTLDTLCGPGMRSEGATAIQCVLEKSSGQMMWNDTLPECKGQSNGQ